jgi:hypothetical protein
MLLYIYIYIYIYIYPPSEASYNLEIRLDVLLHVLPNAKNIEDTGNKSTDIIFIDFRLSWWLNDDSNYIAGLLHCMDVGNVGDIPEIYNASIFRVKMRKVGEFLCICRFILRNIHSRKKWEKSGSLAPIPTLPRVL